MPHLQVISGKQRSSCGYYQQGFTNQQALLLLIIMFPLGVIVLGLGAIVLQRPPSATNQPQATDQPATTKSKIAPVPMAPENNESALFSATDQAISTVNDWIKAMSDGDEVMARRLMTVGAESFHSPEFFDRFVRVTVSDLQTSGNSGSYVNLNGIMTFVYRDGTTQRETRSFTVRTEPLGQAQVTNTEFISVIKSRS
ncbi:MAG: hypothetical protein HQ527_08635 [Cyanobacteria bacterium]|nr:hypothetical protein [Cyanobacteria bacterium bin.51]